ncbi:hypothetical protein [Methylobacterium sp. Leaf125]|uniref:hypothetical protein n=1 Tax=Methylobacterium sp. Leaf125 TaxID=1736265 RepID=UPI000AA279B3|nr:hypothetical protein [Methylobacterium sp. Leaf125]
MYKADFIISRALFVLWGIGAGGSILVNYGKHITDPRIGTDTLLLWSFETLLWIGGMILFGFGAMLTKPNEMTEHTRKLALVEGEANKFTMRKDQDSSHDWPLDHSEPRFGVHAFGVVVSEELYEGIRYKLHNDGNVIARVNGKVMTWRSEADFKTWASKNSVPVLT